MKKSIFLNILWIVPLIFIIKTYLSFEWMFSKSRYEENTPFYLNYSKKFFEDEVGIKLPDNAELIQGSQLKMGPNFITNIFFKVPDIEDFSHKTLTEYSYDIDVLKYPYFGNSKIEDNEYNIYLVPFCEKEDFYKDTVFYGAMNNNLLKDFCSESEAMITQVHKEMEIGVLMGIIPSKKIVWLNYSGWF